MKKVLCGVLLAAAVGFTGCEEEVSSPTPAASNYFPMTQGSSWTYNQISVFPVDSAVTKTISGDTTANGKKYIKIVASDSPAPEYMRRSNDTVFALEEDGTERITAIERMGATWTEISEDEEGSANLTFTVTEKGMSRMVEGKTYSDVLHIHGSGTVTMEGETITVQADGYLAKGVGLIEESHSLLTAKLKSYTIK